MAKKKKTKAAHIKTIGMQETSVRPLRSGDYEKESESFTPDETGQPDPTPLPGIDNPRGVQSGRGPTNQEGEGERQNAELAELDLVEPEIELDKPNTEAPLR